MIVFSPNGVVPSTFWPNQEGEAFTLKESLTPLQPYRERMLILRGISDRVRGDGDNHMRGIGCLLTGIELFPGNIQGGSDTPAGWASDYSNPFMGTDYTFIANALSLPAVTLPCGLARGLPVGFQIIGRAGGEGVRRALVRDS